MAGTHGPSIKNTDTYEALRAKGASKSKAAAIANAQADPERAPSRKGGEADAYEDWTKDELIERATTLGITGRWDMTKSDLIEELRRA